MSILTFTSGRRTKGFAVGTGLQTFLSDAARAWRARQASRAMSQLSDAALHDIGVTRSEIDSAVRYGRPVRR